jgi:hypothetical protein
MSVQVNSTFVACILVTVALGCSNHSGPTYDDSLSKHSSQIKELLELNQSSADIPLIVESKLPGNYYVGDGTGYNLNLQLLGNGRFVAFWNGCLGEYGRSYGTFDLNNDRITFIPELEIDMMKGHLTSAQIIDIEDQRMIVLAESMDFYREHGPSHYCCLHRADSKFPRD